MPELQLEPLVGTNPLGFLAALGVLDAATRAGGGDPVRLRWTEDVVPTAVVTSPWSLDELCSVLDRDRGRRLHGDVLAWGPDGVSPTDIKPTLDELAAWAGEVAERVSPDDRADADLLCALLAEGARAGKGVAKPTHLHFTAGQQQFLSMVRQLADEVGVGELREALEGPWRYESTLPVLGWDVRGERIHALRGVKPSNEKKTGIPGADWLAFVGLTFFPVVARTGGLLTTACDPGWKRGRFRWPLWRPPLTADVVRTLVRQDLKGMTRLAREVYGVTAVHEAPIRRSDQGGYGSFGTPDAVVPSRRQ